MESYMSKIVYIQRNIIC